MENKLNEILSLMKRVNEQFTPGEKESDFSSVQKYGREKYGNFNDNPSLDIFDQGNFNKFKKLKQFMDDIIGVKISLTKESDVKDSDENLILKNIQNILATQRRCGLLGNVFEGLLYKEPDMDNEADLKNGIELKTTGPNSNSITLFATGTNVILDISHNITDLLKGQIGIAEPSVEMYFGKTFFRKSEIDGKEFEFDFDQEHCVEREIGLLRDLSNNSILALFYLTLTPRDSELDYSLRIRGTDIQSLDEEICNFSLPYERIEGPLGKKAKNVFHVYGRVIDEVVGGKKETYAIFTNYESMTLKENLSTRALIEYGILKPIISASLKSNDVIERQRAEKEKKRKEELDRFDRENELGFSGNELDESGFSIYRNKNGETVYKTDYDSQIADHELKTVFKVRGITFKLQLSALKMMYNIEKK